MIEPAHLVGTGGAIGAMARYVVATRLSHDRFPVATFIVNLVGSFVLGLVVFAGSNSDVMLFVGVGACGSFTTYSSFSFETVWLWESDDRFRAALYAIGTFGLCVMAVGLAALVTLVL